MNLTKKICGQILKISRKTLFHTHKSMIIIKFLDNMKTTIVFGTRPEIIKLAPLIKTLNKKSTSLIFTGQHYDYQMGIYSVKYPLNELQIRKKLIQLEFKINSETKKPSFIPWQLKLNNRANLNYKVDIIIAKK